VVSEPAIRQGAAPFASVQQHDAIEPLAAEWDALAERVGAPPFVRPGWFAAWWEAFGAGRPLVLAARRRGELAGVLALRRRPGALASPTNAHTPGFGLVAADEVASRALVGAALARAPHGLALDYLDDADPDIDLLQQAAVGAGHATLRLLIERSPYVVLASEEAVAQLPGSKQASNLRRLQRRLETVGRVEVQVADGRERLGALLWEGYRLESSGWKAARGTAILSHLDTSRFYTAVGRWGAEQGLLRLAFLRLDDRPIAFQFGLQDASAYYLLKGGYDPAYRRWAPGRLLARAVIARAAAEGLRRFEFLGPDEPWKRSWARAHRDRVLLHTFAPTLPGTLERVADTALLVYGKPLARRIVARLR
jgi:CelD/BcsL family acetyltransferase involved in cellulose biosynthesis